MIIKTVVTNALKAKPAQNSNIGGTAYPQNISGKPSKTGRWEINFDTCEIYLVTE